MIDIDIMFIFVKHNNMFPLDPNDKIRYTCEKLLKNYPGRIPIIVDVVKSRFGEQIDLKKKQYLVPDDLSFSNLLFILRKRIKLSETEGLYIMVDNALVPGSTVVRDVYLKHKNAEGYLKVQLCKEEIFG